MEGKEGMDYAEQVLKEIRKYKKILIMDLGEDGVSVCDWLKANGKKIRNFVYLEENADIGIIEGITVRNLNSLLSWKKDALLICMEEAENMCTRLSEVNKLGFENVLVIERAFIESLKREPAFKKSNILYEKKLHSIDKSRYKENSAMDVLLLTPPAWDMYTPFGALPCLTAALQQEQLRVEQIDVGICCFHTKLNADWKEYAEQFKSREYYERTVRMYIDNPYLYFSDYEKGIWFFNGDMYSTGEVKAKYASLNRVQIGVLDAFYQNIANSLSVNIDFNLEKSIAKAIKKYDKNLLIDSIIEMGIVEKIVHAPKVVGISITGTNQFLPACVLAQIVRFFNPNTKIIVGGSALDVFLCSNYENKREILDYFDYLITGEGETSIRKLVQYILQMKEIEYDEIPNLVKFTQDGTMILPEVFLEDVDDLPMPSFEGIDFDLYLAPKPMIPYQASRGCHYGHCAFCNHNSKYRHNYRPKKVSKVVAELIDIKNKYGINYFQFVDEAIRPDHFIEMVEEMDKHEEFRDTKWIYYSRVSYQYKKELLEKAKRNGCELVMFGVETFNQRLLQFIKKGINAETSKYCIKLFPSVGIKTYIWLMCNLPSETIEEMRDDIEDLKEHIKYLAGMGVSLFYLGVNTDMFNNMEDYNIVKYNPYDGIRFDSVNNGEVIDKDKMFEVYGNEYAPLPQKFFFTSNRYTIFYDGLKGLEDEQHKL